MSRQDNKLAFWVLATLTSGIGLIYTLIMYHNIFFAVIGMSVLFLICAFILTQSIISFATMRNKSLNVQIKNSVDGIANQLEAMSGVQTQIGKATYLYTRKAAKSVATLENNYSESQEALYKNLISLSNAHNKATKLMIKYDQSNTTKVISTIKDLRNQLSDTMVQGFDQLQPDNTEVVNTLGEIVEYLKSQSGSMDQEMGMQLNSIARELQNVSNSIQHIRFAANVQPVADMPGVTPVEAAQGAFAGNEAEAVAENKSQEGMEPVEEPVAAEAEPVEATGAVEMLTSVKDNVMDNAAVTGAVDAGSENTEEFTPTFTVVGRSDEQESIETLLEESAGELEEKTAEESAGQTEEEAVADLAEKAVEETIEEFAGQTEEEAVAGLEEKAVKETVEKFAGQAEEEPAAEPVSGQIKTIGDLGNDPNKQLTPDEIAALFAAAEPAPKKEAKPEPEAVAPVSDDPNKQLTPDEIAALFAAAEPAPKKEPVKVQPISDDPNKQLTPDEIAALFAASSS